MVHAVEDAINDGRSVDLGIGHLSPTISTIAADTAGRCGVFLCPSPFPRISSTVEKKFVHS